MRERVCSNILTFLCVRHHRHHEESTKLLMTAAATAERQPTLDLTSEECQEKKVKNLCVDKTIIWVAVT